MEKYTFEERKKESERLLLKYLTKVPIIITKAKNSDIPDIDKRKFLVPVDQTVGQFVYIIRKRVKLSHEKSIFVFVNSVLPKTSSLISEVYNHHKSDDGFLYVTYAGENVFGSGAGARCFNDDCGVLCECC